MSLVDREHFKTGKYPVDRQMEAAELLGIRYHAGRGASTLPRDGVTGVV